MKVIPYVGCNPSSPSTNYPPHGTSKSVYLFLDGLDAHKVEGGGGQDRHRRRRSRGGGLMRPRRPPGSILNLSAVGAAPDANPMARLSLAPLEVVVYASLSFRNLLPVGVGWRVVGTRGDPGARVAEGYLGPGESVHVLEANIMAMTPSMSFQVCMYRTKTTRFCFLLAKIVFFAVVFAC